MRYLNITRRCTEARLPLPSIIRKVRAKGKLVTLLPATPAIGRDGQALLVEGVQFRGFSQQLPLVLDGDGSTVRNIFGSVRSVRTQNGSLVGILHFAADCQAIADAYNAGEATLDLVVQSIAGVELRPFETFQGVTGPGTVLTQWTPIQVAIQLK